MGQQSEAQKSSAIEAPDEVVDEGSFLGPEDTDRMLSALEEIDRKVLGRRERTSPDDEGVFIAPEDIERQGRDTYSEEAVLSPPLPLPPRATETLHGGEPRQSDLLSRIAGELKSIKSEIGTLKNTYDDMISKASSIAIDAEIRRDELRETIPAPVSGRLVPEETLTDLKKLLGYMDRLLESLPENKIDEFARSEYFELYRKIFEFFDLV